MNPLAPQSPQMAPQGAPQPIDASQQLSPPDIAKGHQFADMVLQELSGLVGKPQGELSKQDVFQGAAALLGKGFFNDPQSRAGLVAGLTQLPDDETALRQALGSQLLQVAALKRRLDEHGAQGQPGAPQTPPAQATPMTGA